MNTSRKKRKKRKKEEEGGRRRKKEEGEEETKREERESQRYRDILLENGIIQWIIGKSPANEEPPTTSEEIPYNWNIQILPRRDKGDGDPEAVKEVVDDEVVDVALVAGEEEERDPLLLRLPRRLLQHVELPLVHVDPLVVQPDEDVMHRINHHLHRRLALHLPHQPTCHLLRLLLEPLSRHPPILGIPLVAKGTDFRHHAVGFHNPLEEIVIEARDKVFLPDVLVVTTPTGALVERPAVRKEFAQRMHKTWFVHVVAVPAGERGKEKIIDLSHSWLFSFPFLSFCFFLLSSLPFFIFILLLRRLHFALISLFSFLFDFFFLHELDVPLLLGEGLRVLLSFLGWI